MAALIGRHINKIDKKGRVSVPKPFRDALADQDFQGVYAFPSFKHAAVEICGDSFIQRIITSLDDLELFSDDQDDLASTILGNSYQLAYDTEGRNTCGCFVPYRYCGTRSCLSAVARGVRGLGAAKYDAYNVSAFERASVGRPLACGPQGRGDS